MEVLRRYSKIQNPPKLAHITPVRGAPPASRIHNVRKRLAPEIIAKLAADYKAGMSSTALTIKYSLAKGTVLNLLREQGAKFRGQGLAETDVPEAAQLYRDGWSLKRIAERFGCNAETARVALMAAGIAMRRPYDRVTVVASASRTQP